MLLKVRRGLGQDRIAFQPCWRNWCAQGQLARLTLNLNLDRLPVVESGRLLLDLGEDGRRSSWNLHDKADLAVQKLGINSEMLA